MFKNHKAAIKNISEKFIKNEEVSALLIGGSIAHGFEEENSDVDIMIIVSEEDYARKGKNRALHYYETESCDYESGYIDGKFVTYSFLEKVADYGSEPARFAFDSSIIAFSKIDGLEDLLKKIAKYPVEKKDENIRRFYAQFEAWHWFCGEALKKENSYLLNTAVSNLILFGGRMILAHNELLYPYHKWFLRILEKAEKRPLDLMDKIQLMLKNSDKQNIDDFFNTIVQYRDWNNAGFAWPNQFMIDSELAWLNGRTNVADI
jgi:hypothetical protein